MSLYVRKGQNQFVYAEQRDLLLELGYVTCQTCDGSGLPWKHENNMHPCPDCVAGVQLGQDAIDRMTLAVPTLTEADIRSLFFALVEDS